MSDEVKCSKCAKVILPGEPFYVLRGDAYNELLDVLVQWCAECTVKRFGAKILEENTVGKK